MSSHGPVMKRAKFIHDTSSISKKDDSIPLLDTFHCFPLLPDELQIKIWKFSATPRRVHVNLAFTKSPTSENPDEKKALLRSDQRTPAIMHTCYKSREVGLRMYKPLFNCGGANPVFFKFDLDTLVLNKTKFWLHGRHFASFSEYLLTSLSQVQKLEVRNFWGEDIIREAMHHLLMDTRDVNAIAPEEIEEAVVSGYFSGLKELILVAEKGCGDLYASREILDTTYLNVLYFMRMKAWKEGESGRAFRVPERIRLVNDGSVSGAPGVEDREEAVMVMK